MIISGVVYDGNTETPISGAIISISENDGHSMNVGVSDNDGTFSAEVPNDAVSISVSEIGYMTKTVPTTQNIIRLFTTTQSLRNKSSVKNILIIGTIGAVALIIVHFIREINFN
ncbi:MAG: carboxypeptidase regulatory-like domain-containing protein [Chitinophagaceae bacterium]